MNFLVYQKIFLGHISPNINFLARFANWLCTSKHEMCCTFQVSHIGCITFSETWRSAGPKLPRHLFCFFVLLFCCPFLFEGKVSICMHEFLHTQLDNCLTTSLKDKWWHCCSSCFSDWQENVQAFCPNADYTGTGLLLSYLSSARQLHSLVWWIMTQGELRFMMKEIEYTVSTMIALKLGFGFRVNYDLGEETSSQKKSNMLSEIWSPSSSIQI